MNRSNQSGPCFCHYAVFDSDGFFCCTQLPNMSQPYVGRHESRRSIRPSDPPTPSKRSKQELQRNQLQMQVEHDKQLILVGQEAVR